MVVCGGELADAVSQHIVNGYILSGGIAYNQLSACGEYTPVAGLVAAEAGAMCAVVEFVACGYAVPLRVGGECPVKAGEAYILSFHAAGGNDELPGKIHLYPLDAQLATLNTGSMRRLKVGLSFVLRMSASKRYP